MSNKITNHHTPGPWTYDEVTETIEPDIVEMVSVLSPEETQANGYLIASAPDLLRQRDELLAALKSLLELCEGGTGNALVRMHRARQAIAQASQ